VKGVWSIVLLGVVCHTIKSVSAVPDTVDITSGNLIVDWVARVHGFVAVRKDSQRRPEDVP
jgi:hypothetical protein